MNIKLNEKNQNRIKQLLAQRDQIMAALSETIVLILDAKEVDYEGKNIDLNKEGTEIIITEKK